jgi:hypothetical protein
VRVNSRAVIASDMVTVGSQDSGAGSSAPVNSARGHVRRLSWTVERMHTENNVSLPGAAVPQRSEFAEVLLVGVYPGARIAGVFSPVMAPMTSSTAPGRTGSPNEVAVIGRERLRLLARASHRLKRSRCRRQARTSRRGAQAKAGKTDSKAQGSTGVLSSNLMELNDWADYDRIGRRRTALETGYA